MNEIIIANSDQGKCGCFRGYDEDEDKGVVKSSAPTEGTSAIQAKVHNTRGEDACAAVEPDDSNKVVRHKVCNDPQNSGRRGK